MYSNNVDTNECARFIEKLKTFVTGTILNDVQKSESPTEASALIDDVKTTPSEDPYTLFQSKNAETQFKDYEKDISELIEKWNADPTNRTKMPGLVQLDDEIP